MSVSQLGRFPGGELQEGELVFMSAHPTVDDWIARDAIHFQADSPTSIDAAVDRIIGLLGPSVELLGFGEALHGSEEILCIRNRSEEHTSELQSLRHLVCRLLLEKQK